MRQRRAQASVSTEKEQAASAKEAVARAAKPSFSASEPAHAPAKATEATDPATSARRDETRRAGRLFAESRARAMASTAP